MILSCTVTSDKFFVTNLNFDAVNFNGELFAGLICHELTSCPFL